MSCDELVKEFEKTTEVLPFTKYGLSSLEDFQKAENDIHHLEQLKRIGLTSDEIKLYQDNEAGMLDHHKKSEPGVIQAQLHQIYIKIKESQNKATSSQQEEASTSSPCILGKPSNNSIKLYPEGHPMHSIKELEESLFRHLKSDILPITKRRKILRRLERRKQRMMDKEKELILPLDNAPKVNKPGSLWDVKEKTMRQELSVKRDSMKKQLIGPKERTMYTIKHNKIVRLEPVNAENKKSGLRNEDREQNNDGDERLGNNIVERETEYRAVDILLPINQAEQQLLEGTKMSVDDIKKIERFRDYEPGIPSKVLYLKNISSSVSSDQLSLLFNQFQLENGGPIDVRLLTGRMRGQAFVSFQSEEIAIRALEEVNGTILSGKPIIVQFGRNTNRIQDDNR